MRAKLFVSLVCFSLTLVSVFAQTKVPQAVVQESRQEIIEEPKSDVSITLTSTFLSEYILTNGFVVYDKPVFQNDLYTLFPKSGLWIDLWYSTPVGHGKLLGNNNAGYEFDWSGGWTGKVDGFDLTVGLAHYDLFPIGTRKGDIIQPYVEIDKSITIDPSNVLSPYVRWEPTFVTPGTSFEGGNYFRIGLRHTLNPVNLEKFHLTHGVELTYDDGTAGFDEGVLLKYKAEAAIDVTKHFSVGANVTLWTPLTNVKDVRSSTVVPGGFARFHFEF